VVSRGGIWYLCDVKRRRVILCLSVGVIAIVVFAIWRPDQPREPVYNGKKLSEWLLQYEYSEVASAESHEAVIAVRAIGTNSVPCLLGWVQHGYPAWRFQVALATGKLSNRIRDTSVVRWIIYDKRLLNAELAPFGFRILGPEARSAVPKFREMLNDLPRAEVARRQTEALAGLGNDALPVLLNAVTNRAMPEYIAVLAASAISTMGTNARPAVPALLKCALCEDGVTERANAAYEALKYVAPNVLTDEEHEGQSVNQ
jgi:hypothetical protein